MAEPNPTSPDKPKGQETPPVVLPKQPKTPSEVHEQTSGEREKLQQEPAVPLKAPTPEDVEAIKEDAKAKRKVTPAPSAESLLAAQKLNQEIQEKAKTYFAGIKETPNLEELEQLQAKAESDDVDLIDLRGGHKWLGIKEKDYAKAPELRHVKLSQIYLNKGLDTQTGQIIFTVKKSLDNVYKVKFGLGAGHILPPSIQHIEITDLSGNKRQGTREIRNGKVGYYDEAGYMQIFGGYKIRPIKLIEEGSDEYKQALEAEVENFNHLRETADAQQSGYTDNNEYFGKRKDPVVNLKALRQPIPQKIKEKLDQKTLETIATSRKDLNRIEAILETFSLNLSNESEIDGGIYLTKLNGKGAKMLGWSSENEKDQKHLLGNISSIIENWEKEKNPKKTTKALKEKGITFKLDTQDPNGYKLLDSEDQKEIKDLDKWATLKSIETLQPNNTVKLLRAMQNGGIYRFMNEEFVGNYDLTLSHLHIIDKYANKDQKALKEIFNQCRTNGKVDSQKAISIMTTPEILADGDPGIASVKEVKDYLLKNRAHLGYMLGDYGWNSFENHFIKVIRGGKPRNPSPLTKVTYRWDAMKQADKYPKWSKDPDTGKMKQGSRCCAYTVSTFLGLGNPNAHADGRGKVGAVQDLTAKIIKGNISKTGKTGVVFGFENYRKGDIVVFKGSNKYAPQSYGHIGVVRFKQMLPIYDKKGRFLGKEEYVGIIDHGKFIQGTILPINRGSRKYRHLRRILSSPSRRAAYFRKHPELSDLKAIYEERHTVRVRANAGYFADGSKSASNRISFAVHTDALL